MSVSHPQTARPSLSLIRLTLPLVMAGLCLWALFTRIEIPTWSELHTLLSGIEAWRWGAAGIATAVSFWALGRYDGVAHRHLQTGQDSPKVRRAGMAAIAFSQTVGFGLFTGAYARWRLLPGISALRAGQLTALVGLTFMMALIFISGCSMLVFAPSPLYVALGSFLVSASLIAAAFSFLKPEMRFGRFKMRWPSIAAMVALTFWAFLDIAAAGTALWLLLPEGATVPFGSLLAVYTLALGAAILSSAPGGTGPLELTILSLLSVADSGALLAGLLAFRLVYYALPALLATAMLFLPRKASPDAKTGPELPQNRTEALLGTQQRPAHDLPTQRPVAETAVIGQNGGHIRAFGLNQLALLDSPQISVSLFDPISGDLGETLQPMKSYARKRNALACFYKISSKPALEARKSGWAVMRIASEAILNPVEFSESGSCHRQLRRKLRHTQKADVTILPAPMQLPLEQMQRVDKLWQDRHGRAYGTTMGQFEAGYLQHQRVFLAWKHDRIIGFISLHETPQEWCLDLVRILPDAPDGTGHSLVRSAIAAAAEDGVRRLSLAAVPEHRWSKSLDPGLRRFKACFAPHWEARYIAAPSWPEVLAALAEMTRLVHRPAPPLPVTEPNADWTESAAEEDQEFAAHLSYSNYADSYLRKFHNEVEDSAIARNGRS
ncbi:phosphatidylglycerol lysyltransferase domain-containing protein [Roseobacter sp. SK209-2-6]|uniref:phosphatidylglycerol lysyltransferase domain-containing protein n=1 Tax=Roseobacter sp. SK209-2-6 TaxID=388739 RepID=UPI000559DB9A|nr:phosphatidylglycerol lysyltransferase domain-containing protein [Roseobacter sp. SK209-2-6]